MDATHSVEITADSVDEAVAAALEQLNARAHEVLVEVLEEPSRGLLGIGAKPALVRVKLLRAPEPEKAEMSTETDVTVEDEEEDSQEAETQASTPETGDEATDGQIGRVVLEELLLKMGMEADITVRQDEPDEAGDDAPWVLDITGPDVSKLIGRRGETLSSLQYITRLITSRRIERRANIVVDADSYKDRRTSKLRGLAVRMADQAVQQGRPVTLEPMPANERRIIHMTLRERDDVETESTGEGSHRKVSIIPK